MMTENAQRELLLLVRELKKKIMGKNLLPIRKETRPMAAPKAKIPPPPVPRAIPKTIPPPPPKKMAPPVVSEIPVSIAAPLISAEKLTAFYKAHGFSSLLKEEPPKGHALLLSQPKNEEEETLLKNLALALEKKEGWAVTWMRKIEDLAAIETFIKEKKPAFCLGEPSLLQEVGFDRFNLPVIPLQDLSLYNKEPALKRALWNQLISQKSS